MSKEHDAVNHPKHYAGSCSLECIEAMQFFFGKKKVRIYCTMNAFKYMWRYKNKNGAEDLEKSNWYLKHALKLCKNEKQVNATNGMLEVLDACIMKFACSDEVGA